MKNENKTTKTNAIILAAGQGKRMQAVCSKVLCEVAGKPMLLWAIDAAKNAGIDRVAVVASEEDVIALAKENGCEVYVQSERLGTGHAVRMAAGFLAENPEGDTLILYGDNPLIDTTSIREAHQQHLRQENAVTVITASLEDPAKYGRIIRNGDQLAGIVEWADCTPEQLQIREINSGEYWFVTQDLLTVLGQITNHNAQGEYYLTDAVDLLLKAGKRAGAYESASTDVVLGANDPKGLLEINERAIASIINRHLENGVQLQLRDGVVIGPDVVIEAGAVILPGCRLFGKTIVRRGAVIGPNSTLIDSEIGANTHFESSKATKSTVGENTTIGPYVQLRPDSHIGNRVKIGDFVEVKNSTIGEGTSVAHLTYVGDADVGRFCNFGCGVVFVNYDGESKNRTTVGDYCFVGCNTNLIAPVTLGDGAYTAAGATITKDVPAGALAISREQLTIKDGWATRKLKKYIEKKQK